MDPVCPGTDMNCTGTDVNCGLCLYGPCVSWDRYELYWDRRELYWDRRELYWDRCELWTLSVWTLCVLGQI